MTLMAKVKGKGMNDIDAAYWDARACDEYKFEGEIFYTITPVPYYYARRKLILNLLAEQMKKLHTENVLDYGCGTGEYMCKLYTEHGHLSVRGVDCSKEMLKLACERSQQIGLTASFMLGDLGVPGNDTFDMIYVVAFFAHLEDEQIGRILQNFQKHLLPGGY